MTQSYSYPLPKGWADIVGRIQAVAKKISQYDEALLLPILDYNGISPTHSVALAKLCVDSSVVRYLTPWEAHWLDVLSFYRFVLNFTTPSGTASPEDAMSALEKYVDTHAKMSEHSTGGVQAYHKQVLDIEHFVFDTLGPRSGEAGLSGVQFYNVVLVNRNSIHHMVRTLYGLPSYPVSNQSSALQSSLQAMLGDELPKHTTPSENSVYANPKVSLYGHPILVAPSIFKERADKIMASSRWRGFNGCQMSPIPESDQIELVTISMRPNFGNKHLTYSEHQFRLHPTALSFLMMSHRNLFDPMNSHLYAMELTFHYVKGGAPARFNPATEDANLEGDFDPVVSRIKRVLSSE